MVLFVLKCHMALWHKWHKLMHWLHYMTSSQPMSGPWCVWGISIIFSSVGIILGSDKYDTYVL